MSEKRSLRGLPNVKWFYPDITGSFDQAVKAASQVLAVRGQVIPPTLTDVTLVAELQVPTGVAASTIRGDSSIGKGGHPIERVLFDPLEPLAYPDAILDVQQLPDLALVPADIINPDNPLRHDPKKLARELIRILDEQ